MARVKGGTVARTRRKKTLKAAKGYFGSKHRLYKTAKEQLLHSGAYAYRDRKRKKRDFRKLWITRINAACRENNISYSKFMNGLTKAELSVNRKMLSEIAISHPDTFKDLVEISKSALEGKTYSPKKVSIKAEEPKKEEQKESTKEVKTATKKPTAKSESKVVEKKVVAKPKTPAKTVATKTKASSTTKPKSPSKTATKKPITKK